MNLGRLDANRIGGEKNYRGIGVSEMIDSIINNKENRCSGELSLHVLDIMQSIIKSAKVDQKKVGRIYIFYSQLFGPINFFFYQAS